MSFTRKLFRTMCLMGTLLAAPSTAFYKRGLAANDDIPIWQFGGTWEGADSEVNWQYNWDSTTTNNKQSFCEYVPMLWGTESDHTDPWFSDASYWLADGGSGHLLAFNEPEQSGQSNLTPQDALSAYLTYMTPFVGRAQLGAPAVSNDGLAWITEFMGLCNANNCGVNFIPVHWYNDYDQFSDLQNWIGEICALGNGLQVWLTEVGAVFSQNVM
jgi:Glycosyl hydrolase catalytic core